MEEIDYPKEGDSLYGSSYDLKLNAVISISRFSESFSWQAYIEGYREAAEAVFTHVDKTRMTQDFLVYPILFLWYHHIELRLKEIICRCQDLTDQTKDYVRTHDLRVLWETVKELVTKIDPRYADDPEIVRVGKVIEELVTLNEAFALRYPEKIEGKGKEKDYKFAFPEGIEHMNLGVVNEVMRRCANHLLSVSDGLSARKESRDEGCE